jgi:cellulose synthase/poly-beta-1,6-N-acetylglucosamine synthase-like glycosyltransferase
VNAVVAFVDGNEPEDMYMAAIFHRVMRSDDRFFSYIRMCQHQGKRHMLEKGYRHIKENFPDNDYIVVIDSDTILEPDGVGELVKCIHADKRNACATGNIQIFNRDTFLARIIHSRYLYAFTIERSAQAYVGVMTCCSGPFSIYRQEYLTEDFLEQFIQDTFCGVPVAAGDDRMQTNLLLGKGYYSRQTPLAIATTETPDRLPRYIMQQARWSRSTIRCLTHQVRAIGKHHFYLALITLYETLFPFMVVMGFLPTFNLVHQQNHHIFLQRMAIALAVLVVRTGVLMGFNPGHARECVYNLFIFPLYFLFLLPVKIYAWCTPWVQNWMTSSRKTLLGTYNTDACLIYASVVVWNALIALCFYSKFTNHTLVYPFTQTQWGGNRS